MIEITEKDVQAWVAGAMARYRSSVGMLRGNFEAAKAESLFDPSVEAEIEKGLAWLESDEAERRELARR